jgi:aspartate dehydrogenase
MLEIGIVGFGAIGRAVAAAVRAGAAGETTVRAILVREPAKVEAGGGAPAGVRVATSLEEFLGVPTGLVVEAAGHAALRDCAEPVLRSGRDLMTVSVGAFADPEFMERVRALARERRCRVLVPSGAIAGLDAISAAALLPIDSVVHTVRKPPRAFSSAQLEGVDLAAPSLLFSGSARDGARIFPENVNVAAAVALAGIGLERTELRVLCDPTVARNTHEVEVRGAFGALRLVMENVPSENPKTARIVPWSIAKALRNLTAPVVLGLRRTASHRPGSRPCQSTRTRTSFLRSPSEG